MVNLILLMDHWYGCSLCVQNSMAVSILAWCFHINQWIINSHNTGASSCPSVVWCDLFLMGLTFSFSYKVQFSHTFITGLWYTWWEKRAKFGHKWHHCQNTKEWKINSLEENVRYEAVRGTLEVWQDTITDWPPTEDWDVVFSCR